MTLNVSLTPHLEAFVHDTVSSGRFGSASELVRTALRLLEEHEQARTLRLEWLRQEIQKGLDSGPAEPLTDEFWDGLRTQLSERDRAKPRG